MSQSRSARALAIVGSISIVLLAGCASDSEFFPDDDPAPIDDPVIDEPAIDEPAIDEPAIDEPATPIEPAPDPGEATPAPPEAALPDTPSEPIPDPPNPDDGEESDRLSLTPAVLRVVGIAGGILWWSRRSRDNRSADSAARHQRERVNDLVGRSKWIHDQVLPLLAIADATRQHATWDAMRPHLIDAEHSAAAQTGLTPLADRSPISDLGVALSGLRAALEGYMAVRDQPAADDEVIRAASQTVILRRSELDAAIFAVASDR